MNFDDIPDLVFASSTIDDGNMDFRFGLKEQVEENRKKFFKKISIRAEDVLVLNLEHKDKVKIVSRKNLGHQIKGDSLITADKNIFMGILTADCLPIAIFDPENKTIALVHFSINNYKTILNKIINALMHYLKTKPISLIIEIGPSIGPCHYKMDLWKEAENILVQSGVKKENISNKRICTYKDTAYFSHRRAVYNGDPDFRFANIIGIRG